MSQQLKAVYDGKVFHPSEPVDLPPNSDVVISIEIALEKRETGTPYSFLRCAASLKLRGPEDFSENLDNYLYGNKQFE